MYGVISIEEQAKLQSLRDFYERRNRAAAKDLDAESCLESIQFLLHVINKAESSPFRSMVSELHGYVAYFAGRYPSGAARHTIIIAMFTDETDQGKVVEAIKGKHPALLADFAIESVQLVPVLPDENRTFVLGTGI